MRSVTKQAIREARLKEIKEELLHSERLKVRRRQALLRPRHMGPCGWEVTPRRTVVISQRRLRCPTCAAKCLCGTGKREPIGSASERGRVAGTGWEPQPSNSKHA